MHGSLNYRWGVASQAVTGKHLIRPRLAVVILMALLATACGGSATVSGGAGESADVTAGARDLSAAVAFLGEAVGSGDRSLAATFGPDGGELALDSGVRLVAPEGAFGASTTVNLQTFEVDGSALGQGMAWATAVVVSTVEDVALSTPVRVELPGDAGALRAVQVVDGEAETVDLRSAGADTVGFEIRHFSDVVTLVAPAADAENESPGEEPTAEQRADAEFLSVCTISMWLLFGGDNAEPNPLATDRALGFCATALVRRVAPAGSSVSTACVGDAIAPGVDFRDAIAQCAAQDDEEPAAPGDSAPEDETAAPAAAPPERSGLADSGKTEWFGSIPPHPDSPQTVTLVDPPDEARVFPVVLGEALVEITRTPGTDDFQITVEATRESAKKYALSSEALQALLDADVINGFEPNYCRTLTNETFVGAGTFRDTEPSERYAIILEGVHESIELRECELEDLDAHETSRDSSVWVEVTADGLSVQFSQYIGTLEGPAVPIGN